MLLYSVTDKNRQKRSRNEDKVKNIEISEGILSHQEGYKVARTARNRLHSDFRSIKLSNACTEMQFKSLKN